ncbi:MAG: helix-turn-helix transcriptional regulator, partial [Spirochaetales bacterium]|nr:helix-turn-helix transcriptional regulator [Spirochaetales bacterium]
MQIKKDSSLREKILALSNFIREKYQLELDRALSLKPNTIDKIIKGERQVSFRILKKLSEYFSLPLKVLKDETLSLPPLESLNLDEDLISIQKNDVATVMKRLKQKNFFKHNWFFLSYRKKVRLIFSILLITLPLLVFILYCGSKITLEKINTLRLYKEGSEQTLYDTHNIEQVHYHELLDSTSKINNKGVYYVEVK